MKTNRKVVLVGAGFVGMSMAYSLLNQGGVDELVLIDINQDKTKGEEMDLSHGLPYAPHKMKIKAGSYKDCKNANCSDNSWISAKARTIKIRISSSKCKNNERYYRKCNEKRF